MEKEEREWTMQGPSILIRKKTKKNERPIIGDGERR